jgi:hypothetical protein
MTVLWTTVVVTTAFANDGAEGSSAQTSSPGATYNVGHGLDVKIAVGYQF